jgi:hypothetical protein
VAFNAFFTPSAIIFSHSISFSTYLEQISKAWVRKVESLVHNEPTVVIKVLRNSEHQI